MFVGKAINEHHQLVASPISKASSSLLQPVNYYTLDGQPAMTHYDLDESSFSKLKDSVVVISGASPTREFQLQLLT